MMVNINTPQKYTGTVSTSNKVEIINDQNNKILENAKGKHRRDTK